MRAERCLARAFLAAHPAAAAEAVEQASPAAAAELLADCPAEVVAGALRRLGPANAADISARLPAELLRGVLSELPVGVTAWLLRPLAGADRDRLLQSAPDEVRAAARAALHQPEGTAGSLMDGDVLALPPQTTVKEARRRARRRTPPPGRYLYVVDENRRPVGALSLAELVLRAPGATLAACMNTPVARLAAAARTDAIVAHPAWRELHALPVVDGEGTLVGVLRRETFEGLRESSRTGSGSVGLELAEMLWKLGASAVEEIARSAGAKRTDAGERARSSR